MADKALPRPRRPLYALVSAGFQSVISHTKLSANKRTRAAGLGTVLLLAALMVYISCVYSILFAKLLAPAGGLDVMLLSMVGLCVIVTLLFTLFSAQGMLFGGRDTDILFCLPVPPHSILISKLLAVYLESLLCTLFFLIPTGIVYLIFGGPGGAGFLSVFLLGLLFLPLLPTCLSLLLGWCVAFLSGRRTKKRYLSTAFSILAFAGLLVALALLATKLQSIAENITAIRAFFKGFLFPLHALVQAACGMDILSLLSFLFVCALPMVVCVLLLAPRYQRLLTRVHSHALKEDYRLRILPAKGQLRSLIKKEAAQYFGTSVYVINTGFGLVLLLLASGYLLFEGGSLGVILKSAGLSTQIAFPVIAAFSLFTLSTACTTAVSISLEGSRLWILRESPVPLHTIFLAKAGWNLMLSLPVVVISSVFISLGLGLSFFSGLALFLLLASFALFSSLLGLMCNLLFPRLDAPNDMVVVKQSISTLLSIFAPLLLLAGLGVLYGAYLYAKISFTAYAFCCAGLFAFTSFFLWKALLKKGAELFNALAG